jgi:AcrR family transcriptional regulator
MRAARKDGVATRQRLLEAACEVFASKGYLNATVSEICNRAGANLAAINYHFGGKDELYAEAWRDAFAEALRLYPPDGGLRADAAPEDRLRAFISSLLHRVLAHGRLGHAGKLLVTEMTHPTESIEAVRRDAIRPLFEQARAIMREILGPKVSERDVGFSIMSVLHQCLAIGLRPGRFPAFQRYLQLATRDIDALADHITRFSLAGLAAVRNGGRRTDRVP